VHIDPHKIGVLGFSAGGHLVAAISTHYAKRLYPTAMPPTRKAAAGLCGAYLSGTFVAFRGGMGL